MSNTAYFWMQLPDWSVRSKCAMKTAFTLSLALMIAGIGTALADSYSYDDSGRLSTASQGNGLVHSYSYDNEGNLLSGSSSGTDSSGNGIADWWEIYYFGSTGIDPLAKSADGIPYLLKFALGMDPWADSVGQLPMISLEGANVSLYFRKARAATNLDYLVQGSPDLLTWTDLTTATDTALSQPPVTGLSDEWIDTYRVSVPQSGNKYFLRLKVSQP